MNTNLVTYFYQLLLLRHRQRLRGQLGRVVSLHGSPRRFIATVLPQTSVGRFPAQNTRAFEECHAQPPKCDFVPHRTARPAKKVRGDTRYSGE